MSTRCIFLSRSNVWRRRCLPLRFNQSGVPTELHVLPGAPHGVQAFPDSLLAKRRARLVDAWLAQQLVSG